MQKFFVFLSDCARSPGLGFDFGLGMFSDWKHVPVEVLSTSYPELLKAERPGTVGEGFSRLSSVAKFNRKQAHVDSAGGKGNGPIAVTLTARQV